MDQLKMKKVTKVVFASVLLFVMAPALIFALSSYAATTARAEVTLSGGGTAADPYLIGTKAELEEFRDIVNGANGQTRNPAACAELTADIDLGGSASDAWTPIAYGSTYKGSFNGNGHTVSGVYVNKPTNYCIGFISKIQNAVVKNLTIKGSITGCSEVGGIVGQMYGNATVYKCTNECTVYAARATTSVSEDIRAGGIAGFVYTAGNVINACTNKGRVYTKVSEKGEGKVGGIVGYAGYAMQIKNCVNFGDVTGIETVGGIVGYFSTYGGDGFVEGCYNHGTVTSTSNYASNVIATVGGIAGTGSGRIAYCGNTGTVTGIGSRVSGVVATMTSGGIISCCYNTGTLTGRANVVGIAAYAYQGSITNCYNTGNVRVNDYKTDISAGIHGSGSNETITYVINRGTVTNTNGQAYPYNRRGSIAGDPGNNSVVNHAYYLDGTYKDGIGTYSTNPNATSTKLSAAQMRNQSSFADFDFDNVWEMSTDYPVLRHAHDFTYEVEGTTVTATCDRPYCEVSGGVTASITFYAPTLKYVNGEGNAEGSFDADELMAFNTSTGLAVGSGNITYASVEDEVVTDLAEAPTAMGNYIVTFTLGDAVVRVNYTISKPIQNVSVSMGSWTEGELACDPVLVGNFAGLPVTYFYKVRGAADSAYTTVKPGLEGYYTVKAVVAESETYSEEAVTANFSIKVIRTSVVAEEGTPHSVVDNLDEDLAISLLSEEEQTLYDGGESLRVYLEVKAESETTEISAEDKTAARAAVEASGASEGMYLDLSLFKKIGESEPTAVHESENAFDITVDVPEELATPDFGYIRTYSIIRVHEGVATELPTTYANGKISFSTDRFSTYLIAYSDNFDESGDYIEFTTTVTGEIVRYVDDQNIGDTVTVTYKITHNDGFNSLLLIPQYDAEVFSIQSISANEVALGAATVTQGDGTKKILIENTGAKYASLDGENEFFLTVTYSILVPAAGEFEFGLDLTSEGENNKSIAYYIENGESKGEQTRVAIKVVMVNTLTLVVKQEATIEIGSNNADEDADLYEIVWDYFFVYNKEAVGDQKVATLTDPADADGFYVEYTYSGDATPVVVWYEADYVYNDLANQYEVIPGAALSGAPVAAGNYVIGISAPATLSYYAVEEAYAYVHISPLLVEITIENKESAYGDEIAALTYTANRAPIEGDSFTIALSTTATSSSSAGTYPITGEAQNVVGSYTFHFTNGVYTITKKTVTLTALDQQAVYTGAEPTVDQTKYSVTGIADENLEVSIAKEAGVNAGAYVLTPSLTLGENYEISVVTGIFTITTQGKNQEYVEAFFAGLTETYNGEEYDLLFVSTDIPAWISYTAENNLQTDASDYTVTVTVTISEQDAANYTDGEEEFVFTKSAKINPLNVTLSVVDITRVYGQAPVLVPEFTVTGTTEELDYTYAFKDNGVAFTPAADTAVGVYDIVLTAGNNPNFIVTYADGTYTVSKATAQITASANDVYYNRALDTAVSASVNTISLNPTLTYYSDSACTQEVTPVNAGTYYAKAVVSGTDNYNGAEEVISFEIKAVKLEGVTFTYDHGNAVWTAVANDIGKTSDEDGVEAMALKEGVTVTYKVYDANNVLVATFLPGETRTFDAQAATTYSVVATASDANYVDSVSVMVAAYVVSFDEGEHLGNPEGTVTNMPATQYIFAGQKAVAPASNPAVESCTFSTWALDGGTYRFVEEVNGNITLVAAWDAVTYTVTLKYLPTSATEGTDMFTVSGLLLNQTVSYATLDVAPVKASENPGIYYTFADKWTDENSVTYDVENGVIAGFVVTGDMTFIAVFDTNYNAFSVTYYLANGVSTAASAYEQIGEKQSVTYGDSIEYRALVESQVAWFRIYGWYSDTDRTAALLTTMPNHDISVYAGYVFDVGVGDVNADGSVNADDITIYRQWIVGGYEMTVVTAGEEWATVTGDDYDAEKNYFLKRVADANNDDSRDIRDVSVTRMAIAGGYGFDLLEGYRVSGTEVVRTAPVYSLYAAANGLNTYGRIRLFGDVSDADHTLTFQSESDLYVDLGGYNFTVKSLTLLTTGENATITLMNGSIKAENGITITAPNGNVVIEDVNAYVDGTPINLQAADSSLHFAGSVGFYNGNIGSTAPAAINVEEGTHVVLEEEAEVVFEKIVVTENNFEQAAVSPIALITLDNKTETEVSVEWNVVITDLSGLLAARTAGGSYVLGADLTYSGQVCFVADATLDLNGHTIRSVNDIALSVSNGATLTIEGEGNVMAQEACLMAFNGSTLIVNGGTYTSVDNFVIGTNGTVKPDNDMGHNVITINGGTFNGGIQSAGYVACGVYVANSDTVTVNGGTFNITNGVGILARSGNTTVGEDVVFNVTGDGHLGKVGDSKVTVPAGEVLVLDLKANYPGGTPTLTNNSAYEVSIFSAN